ncbi:MAG: DUF4396 domain-containing protein [Candidatus Binataceae bacterium]
MWFILTILAVLFVAIDIRSTPESPVLKWGFILVTLFTGPLGALLYVLGCREPLPGLHQKYVAAQWRQALGSAMHCVAGDGVGIITGAVIGGFLVLPMPADASLEYVLGFLFGWGIFQALFMRDMAGASYIKSLQVTFIPELLSMNCLMAAMIPVAAIAKAHDSSARNPASPVFWFVMSMALTLGAFAAYPMNWWLVKHGLKHGMLTVRPAGARDQGEPMVAHGMPHMTEGAMPISETGGHSQHRAVHAGAPPAIGRMTIVSFVALAAGVIVAAFAAM